MKFKKIVVRSYTDMDLRFTTTVTLESSVDARNFEDAKSQVVNLLYSLTGQGERYTVEWKRDGFTEGYMVSPRE